MTHFDGMPDPSRREALDMGAESMVHEGWREYERTATTWARRMVAPFEVQTIEGAMRGNAGDYLACGADGELYPIRASTFEKSFRRREP